MLPASLEREISAAAQIRGLQARVARLETLENQEGTAGCLTLIEDQLLASPAASVTFSAIPQIHNHLWLWITAIAEVDENSDFIRLTFNGDTAGNYGYTRIRHVSNTPNSSAVASGASFIQLETASANPGITNLSRAAQEVNIYDYVSATHWKSTTWKSLQMASAGGEVPGTIHQSNGGGFWKSTTTITSLGLDAGILSDFAAGSRFTLYGLC